MKKQHLGSRRILSLAEIQIDEQELSNTDFQVLRVGEFYDKRYGKFKITEKLLKEIKANFDSKVLGVDVALDTNHEPDKGAKAWIDSLEVREGGLWAKFKDFTSEGQQMLKEKIYKYFSVEFKPLEKVVNGKKITINNVLRGIALTNRPVIKEMQPTFFSEELSKSFTKRLHNMNVVKQFAESLLQRDAIVKDDVNSLKLMFASLSEDEQAEAKESVEKVETEAAAQAEAAAAADKKEDPAEKPAEGEEGTPEAQLAEMREAKEATDARLAELEQREAARVTNDRVSDLLLSETNLTGVPAASKDALTALVASLSEDQFAKFSEVMGKVQTVDAKMFSETGDGGEGAPGEGDEAAKDAEARALAEKMVSDSGGALSLADALGEAYKELGMVERN